MNPVVPTYANTAPYITPGEFQNSATGVDITQLVPGKSQTVQAAALATIIGRASSWADSLCYQILAATENTQFGVYRRYPDGTLHIPLDYTPLVMVTGVRVDGAALSDLSGIVFGSKTITLPAPSPFGPVLQTLPGRPQVAVDYINGYANTTLSTPAASGDQQVMVTDACGIVPGLQMSIFDGQNAQQIRVDPSYTIGALTVPLTAPLTAAVAAGAGLSALPQAIKQATVSLTCALIKSRAAQAIVMGQVNEQATEVENIGSGGMTDLEIAVDLLGPFRRVP